MSNCWCTSASSSCKSTSSMQEALADFDAVTSKVFWENTSLCSVEESIDREPWSDHCGDIFRVLSDLELQPASSDGHYSKNLPECIFPEQEVPDASMLGSSHIDRESWSDCGDIFRVLSDLEFQPASPDGHYSKNLPECIFPEQEVPDASMLGSSHGTRKGDTSFQHHTAGWPKGIHKKQAKGKQAEGTTKQNCLPDESNSDGVISKKRCSERRRRKRINAKLTSLRQLLPNSYKTDQASILEDAIKYIQSLKLHLDVVFKSSGQNQLQAMYLPQTDVSAMNPAFGIGAAQQFVAPCSYGSMVTPESIQLASIPQHHAVLCPPNYFTAGLFPLPFESTEHR